MNIYGNAYLFFCIYVLSKIIFSSTKSIPRTANGFVFEQKRFIPSQDEFYLGLFSSRNRLRCIQLCQESSLCQTMVFEQRKQECLLFSEHVEYGSGRLLDENNPNLFTIRLDKDSYQIRKQSNDHDKTLSSFFSSSEQKNVCDNCEL